MQLDAFSRPQTGTRPQDISASRPSARKKHSWVWVIALIVIVLGAVWYYRSTHNNSQQSGSAGTPAAGKGHAGGPGSAGYAVPVVVATPQRRHLPVYFDCLC